MDALLRRRAMIAADGGTPPTPPTPEPVFYDYLVFDGAAYIDTDIIPSADASFRCNFGNETTKAAQRVFMCKAGTSDFIGMFLASATTSTTRTISVYYGGSSAAGSQTLAFSSASYTFFLTPKRYGWGTGSTIKTITKGSSVPTGGLVLGATYTHTGQQYTGTMGTYRIYGSDAQNATSASDLLNNYTPAYTLRPCTYNEEAGMWCVETNTFYGNTAGTGTLTVRNSS